MSFVSLHLGRTGLVNQCAREHEAALLANTHHCARLEGSQVSVVQSSPLHSTPLHSGAALPRGPLQASGNLSLCNNLGPNPSSPPPPPRSLADLKAGRLAPLCSGCEPGRPVAPPVEQPPGPQIGAARSTGRPAHLCTFWTNSLGRRADGRPLGPLELRARRHNGSRRRASLGPMADPKWPASRHSERWPGNED